MPKGSSSSTRKTSSRGANRRKSGSRGFLNLFSKIGKSGRKSKAKEPLLSPLSRISRGQAVMVAAVVAAVGGAIVYMTFAATSDYSFWAGTVHPGHIAGGTKPIELGLRFSSSAAGSVTGVRFYKGAGNTGTHTGHLWDTNGKALASATFSKETATGWQTVTFSKAVAISAGHEYIVSYYSPKGHFAYDSAYFKGKKLVTKALTAPAATTGKPNGIFHNGASGFPASSSTHDYNYGVDVVFRPNAVATPTPKPTATATPKPTTAPTATPKPTPVVPTANLTDPAKKEIAMQLVSSAENSSLNWKAQYGYIEDIGDGRGYTGGIIGYCSGCGDMAQLVSAYNKLKPTNVLAKYLPTLTSLGNAESASHSGLDPNFTKDWKTAAADTLFQQAQNNERDRVYFNPSVNQAIADGVHALGQFIYYDAMVMHGPGNDSVSFGGIRAAALKKAKSPAQGGNETTYLNAFLDVRKAAMLTDAAHDDSSRVDTEQRVFLNAGNLNLNTPLSWKTYGDSYTIK
jgi:hypothetical protein